MAGQSGEIRITRRDADRAWRLPTGATHVFRVSRLECHVLELEDVHFNHDSAVLLPDHDRCGAPASTPAPERITGLAVLRACFVHARRHPDQQLLIAGHTDTSGKPGYNVTLSEKRADVVRAVLLGERAAWVKIVAEQNSKQDVPQILSWVDAELGWGCAPGVDTDRAELMAAIKTFQRRYNEVYGAAIAVDGVVGPQTWGGIFDVYKGAWGGRFASRGPFREAWAGQVEGKLVPPKLMIDNTLLGIPIKFGETLSPKKGLVAAGDFATHAADFAEYAFLYERAWVEVPAVRQALAALPSFMIFDDHEITDDWNFDQDWVRIAHESPKYAAWPDTMTDGLAAYWLYQGWGNLDPAEWPRHRLGRILLDALARGTDALPALRTAIATEIRPPRRPGASRSITWHYKLPITPDVIVLNCRAERVVGDSPRTSQMFTEAQFLWLQQQLEAADRAGRPAAFVVTAVPVLMPPALAFGQALEMSDEPGLQEEIASLFVTHSERRGTDIEHWLSDGSFVRLQRVVEALARSRQALKSVVFISGDVHFSYNRCARLAGKNAPVYPEMVQLVCSALRNEIGTLRTFKLRRVAEPRSDALSEAEDAVAVGVGTRLKMAFVRWLANPWRPTTELLGAEHTVAGFRGIANLRQTLLVDNSVAVVDAWFTRTGDPNYRPGEFVLRERYLVAGQGALPPVQPQPPHSRLSFGPPVPGQEPPATEIPEFWYQTVPGAPS